MHAAKTDEPKLAKPGAGLPFPELLVARYIIFPHRFRTTSPAQAIEQFKHESDRIVALSKSISEEHLFEKRLITRIAGLEDSSRYWSVAMTLEHLVTVGDGMRKIVFSLSQEKTALPETRIEDVKPSTGVISSNIIAEFETMTAKFIKTAESIDFSKDTKATHAHPWFGALNARQWMLFAAPHERIHRKQIEQIISKLEK